jgi:hypothetical protein
MKAQEGEELFEAILNEYHGKISVSQMKMFGSVGLKVNGKVFAFLMKGKLVLKLPKGRVSDIIASKKGAYFDPGHGRISKEWVAIVPSTKNEWINLTKEAEEFVVSIKNK